MARAKAAAAAVLATLLLPLASAAQTPTEAAAEKQDTCMALAHYDVTNTALAFSTYQMPIFGKHPERWTVNDVTNLFANIQACDGKPSNLLPQARVSYGTWRRLFSKTVLGNVLGVARASTEIATALKPIWPPGMKMPYCADLLEWKRDPVWLVNNAKDIFGSTLYSLTDEGAGAIKNFANACRPVVAAIVKARGSKMKSPNALIDDIVSSVERDQSAQRWEQIEFVPQFKVQYEGQQIPFSYVGKNTQEIVLRLNTSERNRIPLNQDELATISRWTTDMLRMSKAGPDTEYVKAIKAVVAAQLFSQSTPQ